MNQTESEVNQRKQTVHTFLQSLHHSTFDNNAINNASRYGGLYAEWTATNTSAADSEIAIALITTRDPNQQQDQTTTVGTLYTESSASYVGIIVAFTGFYGGTVHRIANSSKQKYSDAQDHSTSTAEVPHLILDNTSITQTRVICNAATTLALSICERLGYKQLRTEQNSHISIAHALQLIIRGDCELYAASSLDENCEPTTDNPKLVQAASILLTALGGSVHTTSVDQAHRMVTCVVLGIQREVVDRVVECVMQTFDITCFSKGDQQFLMHSRWLQSIATNGSTWSGTSPALQSKQLVVAARADSAIRGKHSSVVRVSLEDPLTKSLVTSMFLKRIEPAQLETRPILDWPCDVASYCAEVGFFAHLREYYSAYCAMPKLFHAHVECYLPQPAEEGDSEKDCVIIQECIPGAALRVCGEANIEQMVKNTRLVLITQDLAGSHVQELQLTPVHLESAIEWLAAFHAAGLGLIHPANTISSADDVNQVESRPLAESSNEQQVLALASLRLWPQGAFWTADKRMVEVNSPGSRLAVSWTRFCEHFESTAPDLFANQRVRELGNRVVAQADRVTELLGQTKTPCTSPPGSTETSSASSTTSPRVVVHGDFKTANIFFHAKTQKLMPIDFQWCGIGLGALDLVYLILSSSTLDVLQDCECIGELIRKYHTDFFTGALQHTGGVCVEYSLGDLERDMQLVMLDYVYSVFSSQWECATPQGVASQAQVLGRCVHNRSIPHLLWLVKMIDALLHEFEKTGRDFERTIGGCARWFRVYD